jgi:chemotaxis protein CheD
MNVCMIPATPLDHFDAAPEERVYLNAGTLYVTSAPALINTVLSSSVSVCLWSPGAAGINHYVLPRGGTDRSLRFGNHALAILLERMAELGADTTEILAAVFGGAALLADEGLGRRNLSEAREFLARREIPVIREDIGGNAARRLAFRTVDGSTIVRRL